MSGPSFESDPTKETFRKGLEALFYFNLPGINDVIHDAHWVLHGDSLGSETPELDKSRLDAKSLEAQDFARINPEAQAAAEDVVEAWAKVAMSVGEFLQAREEFYATFGNVQHGEEKRGDFDFSHVDTPDDL